MASPVTAALLLVLLLRETLSSCDDQVLMSLLCVIVRDVSIAGQSLIDFDIFWDSGERLVRLSWELFDRVGRERGGELARCGFRDLCCGLWHGSRIARRR